MEPRSLARSLMPPLLVDAARRWSRRGLRFRPVEPDWAAALRMSRGYGDQAIADRVAVATREVAAGRAAYERDSVTFAERAYRYPVVAALMHTAALAKGRLHVVDLGGALGSTYWQCRPLLAGLAAVRWVVVEQASYVAIGRREFSSDQLLFADSLSDPVCHAPGGIALACSVLQYLERPAEALEKLAQLPLARLLIDRTPLHPGPEDHLTVQQVPRHIYDASYPCWILSRPRLLEVLAKNWDVVDIFGCDEGQAVTEGGLHFEFGGIYLERRA